MLTQDFIDEMKQKLEEQKKQLQDDLDGLLPHTEMGDEADENASEVEVDEVSQDLIVRMKADLEKIDKALAKIAARMYGVDDNGKEISEARLRALPWADKAI